MTPSRGFARIALSSGRWLLPWIAMLALSATLAYAMSSALAGPSPVSLQQVDLQVAGSTGEATGAVALGESTTALRAGSADRGRSLVPQTCAAIGGGATYVGIDWWIVAERQKLECEGPSQ
jgi:hypothetical protein